MTEKKKLGNVNRLSHYQSHVDRSHKMGVLSQKRDSIYQQKGKKTT